MIKIVNGNILNATEDIICQQVNCKAGLAKQIRDKYPNVYTEYKEFCKNNKELLGKIQTSVQPDGKYIVNVFVQDGYGREYTSYFCLKNALELLLREVTVGKTSYVEGKKLSIAIPYEIGCGLGGGNWEEVYEVYSCVMVFDNYSEFTRQEICIRS